MSLKNTIKTGNRIGSRGEYIFATRITTDFMFDATFLGEKHEATDFCVEFVDEEKHNMFFVQVKSTQNNTPRRKTMPIYPPLLKGYIDSIVNQPYPTYLAAVDVNTEEVYITGLFQSKERIASIPKKHKLSLEDKVSTKRTLELLKEDVKQCWNELEPDASKKTKYKSQLV